MRGVKNFETVEKVEMYQNFCRKNQNISLLGRTKSNDFFCWVFKKETYQNFADKIKTCQNLVERVETPNFGRDG